MGCQRRCRYALDAAGRRWCPSAKDGSRENCRDRGSPGGCDNQNDNGRWNGCCDKIRFRCLSAEGAGKPTSPYSTLISLVPGRPTQDCAPRCRVLGAKRKSCARPEQYLMLLSAKNLWNWNLKRWNPG